MNTTGLTPSPKWTQAILFGLLCVALCLPVIAAEPTTRTGAGAKYIFLFIGDGMGPVQVQTTEWFLQATQPDGPRPALLMNRLATKGKCSTYSATNRVTDSAAAGTALASGIKTGNGIVGMDVWKKYDAPTIAERLHKNAGYKIGILSSVSLDHATPACYYAHQPSRDEYVEIAEQLAACDFEYFAGGGLKGDLKAYETTYESILARARENGFEVVRDRAALEALTPGAGKVLAMTPNLADSAAMPFVIDAGEQDITLAEFTRKGIELLDNPTGFFMMVEGGKIDWACHANDAGAMVQETIAFDEAIAEAYTFYQQHPEETLIVVTADHECGGLQLLESGDIVEKRVHLLGHQTVSYERFNHLWKQWCEGKDESELTLANATSLIESAYGFKLPGPESTQHPLRLSDSEVAELQKAFTNSLPNAMKESEGKSLMYGSYVPLTITCSRLLARKAGIGWKSLHHTDTPVPVMAIGVGQERFAGMIDNTDIPHAFADLAQSTPKRRATRQ